MFLVLKSKYYYLKDRHYLASVVYNGTMNKTKLVDAVQAVNGVLDVEMGTIVAWAVQGLKR